LATANCFTDPEPQRIQLDAVDLACFHSVWSSCSPNWHFHRHAPMERAEPAIVRTAASRSAAVMSFIWSFAIFFQLGAGDLPAHRVRRGGALSTWWLSAVSVTAGGDVMMKVKLLSYKR
jgi:hypothetical protein